MKHHHNTTHETGALLASFEHKAISQEDKILEYFLNIPHSSASPWQVQIVLRMTNVPLTSIRRAMTNLTTQGLLEKTDDKIKGAYGRPECQWRLSRHVSPQSDMFQNVRGSP